MKLRNLFFIFILLLVATSCTIHKRHYGKGYFISWNKAYKSEQPTEQEKPHEHIVSKTIDEEILEQEEIQVEQSLDFTSQYTNVDNEQKHPTQKVNKSFSSENNTVSENRVNKIMAYTNEEQKVNLNALLGFIFGVVSLLIILGMIFIPALFFLLVKVLVVTAGIGFSFSFLSIKEVKNNRNNSLLSDVSQKNSETSHKKSKFFMLAGLILNGLIVVSLVIFALLLIIVISTFSLNI
jgi:hypothetical protein